MKLFLLYLKEKKGAILTFFFLFVIFFASFLLYRLPLAAVLYPSALCLIFGAAAFLWGYFREKRRYKRLTELKNLTAAMISALPEAESPGELGYTEIVEGLKEQVTALESQAETALKDASDYYTLWAHQIKTPIASMKLALQSEDTKLSRRLTSELLRIEQYVEMVLTFFRLDARSGDYVFRKYDLDGIIRQCIKKFAPEFIDRKIHMEFKPTNETVVTDEKWLSFVIEQLLSNALKYTKAGGVRIYMTEDKILSIEDTGIGIAREDIPRIFDKGYTGCNGRIDKSASGIGLYLCKRICDNLGFDIFAESELGRGTVISIDMGQYDLKTE